ncbi:MAG TPA: TetR/AcrR family transcriptional regulator [Trebonia sp.]
MSAAEPNAGGAPQRPSMRTLQKERTRRLLRDAAVQLFAAKGYSATTIDDITTAVGASRATFYLHYDSKARIVSEVYEEIIMPETMDFYQNLDALDHSSEKELRGWLDDAIGFFERHHDVLMFAEEAYSVEPSLEELSPPRLLDRCAEAMPRYLARHQGRERQQAQLRLELLILQISLFTRLWVGGRWPVKRDLMLDVLLDLWRHGLRADRPAAAAAPLPTT